MSRIDARFFSMRLLTVPILILLLVTQSFSYWIVQGVFRINRDYIAKTLCENRYRPQMNCKGNCVLMKKMKQAEEQEKNAPASIKLEVSAIFLSDESFAEATQLPILSIEQSFPGILDAKKPVDRAFAIFHPPSHS